LDDDCGLHADQDRLHGKGLQQTAGGSDVQASVVFLVSVRLRPLVFDWRYAAQCIASRERQPRAALNARGAG
jgi:hypothetical protein